MDPYNLTNALNKAAAKTANSSQFTAEDISRNHGQPIAWDNANPGFTTAGVPWSQLSNNAKNTAHTNYTNGINAPLTDSVGTYKKLGYGVNYDKDGNRIDASGNKIGDYATGGKSALSGGGTTTGNPLTGGGTATSSASGGGQQIANKTWVTKGVNTTAVPQNIPQAQEGKLRLLSPDGTWTFTGDPVEINNYFADGYRSIRDNGDVQEVRPFEGGYLVDYGGSTFLPIDTVLNGRLSYSQLAALKKGGYSTDADKLGLTMIGDPADAGKNTAGTGTAGTGTGGGAGSAGDLGKHGYFGDQTGAAKPFAADSDLQYMLRQLIDEARNQGVQGQQAYGGVFEDLKNYLGFARAGAEKSMADRDRMFESLFGSVQPGITKAIAGMNDSTGLSPEAMQALRMQAVEGTQRDYEGQAEALKSQLGSRGAYGGGAAPGDLGAIIRGYGPLMGQRDAQRGNLLAGATLADEQRKFDTLGLNRQTGLGAMGAASSLAGTVGSAYNPAALLGAQGDALSGILSGIGGMNNAGFTGTQLAGGLAGQWGESQPGSFRNTLLAALAGAGGKAVAGFDWGKLAKSIYGALRPGPPDSSGSDTGFGSGYDDFYNKFKDWVSQQGQTV